MERQEPTTAVPTLPALGSVGGIALPPMSLVPFSQVPIGGHWSLNIGGRPGLGVARKTSDWASVSEDQVIEFGGGDLVWWLHQYQERK
ncbi:MAG TPA: hypothetical protein VGN72_04965 [Tepidisphaeraceae bacterium]|jgi:hypothetical protein|nr:hypothetical protein [Tepidisphaeraceae bacterium]